MHDPIRTGAVQPTRIGDYIIHKLIAEGGMAQVYAGEEALSHRPVAVKILRTELANSDQVRRQFLTEIKILTTLDHPNIVRCLACTEFDGRPVMVLELLEGWTLREMLASRTALAWPEMVRYALQIARGLGAAHARVPSVVHRDLKPENVIVQPDGTVKVMDFGIAKIVRTMTGTTNHAVGTLQYMSPEQIDAKNVDGRADLFALGLLMWEMLAGRPPFEGGSPRVLLDQICNQPTPRLPDHIRGDVPVHVVQLIDWLLAKDPAERPASANEIIAHLEPWTNPGLAAQNATELQPSPKVPLQRQVEQKFDDVADAVSRFGRATSALIVRVLIGLMILPAAAVIFVGIPGLAATINLVALAQQKPGMAFQFEYWARSELAPVLLVLAVVLAVVFMRACWVHHRDPVESGGRKYWLLLGAVVTAAWAGVTAIEFMPGGNVPENAIHYACIASLTIWLALTLSWATGRLASYVLRRLERAHD